MVFLFVVFNAFKCNTSSTKYHPVVIPIPVASPKSYEEYCNKLKDIARQDVKDNNISFHLLNDTFRGYINHEIIIDSFLHKKYGLNLVTYGDSFLKTCSISIFDSFIEARFGKGSKQRIINELKYVVGSVPRPHHPQEYP